MPLWTWYGLSRGKATTDWPLRGNEHGQDNVLGLPRYHPEQCRSDCSACADACLPQAITLRNPGSNEGVGPRLDIDYGRCIACQSCVEACPEGAMQTTQDWAFGVREREDLIWRESVDGSPARTLKQRIAGMFRRSLHIRHLDAGSCNGCESELQALGNPFYNLHRLGIFFTPSPRAADLLLVTGPVTYAMKPALLSTYDAMPEPRWVMASGTCAVSGAMVGGDYSCHHGVQDLLPVDLFLPGCPPSPAALIEALLVLLDRHPQRVQGGHYHELG